MKENPYSLFIRSFLLRIIRCHFIIDREATFAVFSDCGISVPMSQLLGLNNAYEPSSFLPRWNQGFPIAFTGLDVEI